MMTLAQLLLEHGADTALKAIDGSTSVHECLDFYEITKLILESAQSANESDEDIFEDAIDHSKNASEMRCCVLPFDHRIKS